MTNRTVPTRVVLWTATLGLFLVGCLPPPNSPNGSSYADGKGDDPAHSTDAAQKTITLRTLAFSFDVSTYPVSVTTCTHQGLGSRLIARDQVEVTYREDVRGGRITLTELSRKPKPGSEVTILNRWYDHGRTVNYASGCQDPVTEVVVIETLKPTLDRAGESPIARSAPIDTISACITAIPDGPCDASGMSCNYCLPNEAGLSSCTNTADNHGGHNSNNDAQALRRLWDACTNLDAPGGPAPSVEDLCTSPDGENVASCHSVFNDSESVRTQSGACADDPSLYGTSNSTKCTGKQPLCGPTAQIVCGLG